MAFDPAEVTNGAEVTVVTGSAFTVGALPAKGTGPAPTTTTVPASSAIAAPNAPTTVLEPWDPRACSPGVTPTAPIANET